ncbi:hypothetical protein [Mycobacterium sp. ACS4331]|uniref:hypothetical protein n=1 Tax=Mycobacterium sp. ACS4331 TaxID=1834121 RepID=UPI0007FCAB9C|nr:hypothetical protein [Mycobacterium sp. ACS4331]OBF22557.1 hypothetical protein A5727_07350 [Mycobacterium sp. ACS4331]
MRAWAAVVLAVVLTSCGAVVDGTATWPGAKLDRAVLTDADFPPGVLYDRVVEQAGEPDGAGGPPPMLSEPPGCTDGLTKVIAASAERGPGSAAKYSVIYDGARIVMTVLSWHLDLPRLEDTAARCATFQAFFDRSSPGIPMTTTRLPSSDGRLMYQQTMSLGGQQNSIYMVFANVDSMAVFGLASPTPNPKIPVKAELPQTFFDVVDMQVDRIRVL